MASVLGIQTPDLIFGVPVFTFLLLAFLLIVFLIGVVFILFIYSFRIYNKRIILFENIGGRGYQPVFKDKARLIKVGDGGEELLWLRKKKVFRTAYGKKMGKNTYWFSVGPDGYWYNVVLGDIDTKLGMLDIEPTDREMRFMNVAMRRNAEERYKSGKFMEKYGAFVITGIFLLIIVIAFLFLVSKMATISKNLASSLSVMKEVAQTNQNVLTHIDNICGGGLKPA